ncbi:hypothetical protein Leryth_024182 [Lithospermum erythrorhizon]|nr:hypothetical protein Leryth_024182 [Lithospermum erythrorhizon]
MASQVCLSSRRQRSKLQSRGLEGLMCGNYDMATNVVSQLPILSLHRLKLVSKQLNDLISDRAFARLQKIKTEPVCGLFYQDRYLNGDDYVSSVSYVPQGKEENQVFKTVMEFLPEKVVILVACNGLVCCRSCFCSLDQMVYVCNPLRKEWNKIELRDPSNVCSLALAFDPLKNPIHVSTHFKVVSVKKVEGDKFLFDIYSSETGRWRNSKEICLCNHNLFKNKGIFAGGDLYWLTDGHEIIMLNLESELTLLLKEPLPATEFTMRREFCIGESEGMLHYVLLSEHGLQLWMLEDCFASQWGVKYSISLKELEAHNHGILFNLTEVLKVVTWLALLAFKDGILFMRVSGNIYSFDFETRRAKKLCDLSTLGAAILFPPIVIPYSLSLVPLDEK